MCDVTEAFHSHPELQHAWVGEVVTDGRRQGKPLIVRCGGFEAAWARVSTSRIILKHAPAVVLRRRSMLQIPAL